MATRHLYVDECVDILMRGGHDLDEFSSLGYIGKA